MNTGDTSSGTAVTAPTSAWIEFNQGLYSGDLILVSVIRTV